MMFRKLLCAPILALLTLQAEPVFAVDEGMWPFNNVPRADIKRRYGFEVTDEWLRKLQLASVRFNNGGSGSFVSPNGLVLTNYHIIEDIVGELSSAQKDYAKEGFVARTQADELKAPSLELNVLESIEDVTSRINGAVNPQMTAVEANAARRAQISAIESESTQATGLRSDVVTLYQGGQYNLYRYKKYTDVRLVFVPEFQSAFFGGDPDNFNFPRFNLDMALVRVYENDQPVKVTNYFKWSKAGAKAGELVFVTGHPGSTSRLNTLAHLESLRDVSIPLVLRMLETRRDMLKKYMTQGEEQTRLAQNELNSVENSIKVYKGQIGGLQDKTLMAKKIKVEQALRASVNADARKKQEYGEAWDAIAKAHKDYASYARERRMLDLAAAFNSVLFGYARTIVRLAEESEKPNAERLPEFTDSRRASLELTLYSTAPIHEDFEKLKLTNSLEYMRSVYGPNFPLVQRVLKGKTPEARAAELIDGTKLKDPEHRKQLAAGGLKAIQDANDPMIELARSVDNEAREARKRYEDEVISVERTSYGKIARALFESEGTKLYPDATFTLRLSYGAVKGYWENGKFVSPLTTLGGLYSRAAKFKYKFPYVLAPRWVERKPMVNLKTPFNFVSTNDIVGGNSGSPTINKRGELVGLIFDGNIQSLVGNFDYDESINRSISVDVRGMWEVLRRVFDASEIVDELAKA
ncbi:MAG: S46 family peptidase [Pyrinomonadaceae bacterium]